VPGFVSVEYRSTISKRERSRPLDRVRWRDAGSLQVVPSIRDREGKLIHGFREGGAYERGCIAKPRDATCDRLRCKPSGKRVSRVSTSSLSLQEALNNVQESENGSGPEWASSRSPRVGHRPIIQGLPSPVRFPGGLYRAPRVLSRIPVHLMRDPHKLTSGRPGGHGEIDKSPINGLVVRLRGFPQESRPVCQSVPKISFIRFSDTPSRRNMASNLWLS